MNDVLENETRLEKDVKEISKGLLDISDFTKARSPLELAEAEVVGKRIRAACDKIADEIHMAKKKLGIELLHSTKSKKGRSLNELENLLSLIHGDVETIGNVAVNFISAPNREAAFENMNRHYAELVQHVMSLINV